jgi:hypothetical protein
LRGAGRSGAGDRPGSEQIAGHRRRAWHRENPAAAIRGAGRRRPAVGEHRRGGIRVAARLRRTAPHAGAVPRPDRSATCSPARRAGFDVWPGRRAAGGQIPGRPWCIDPARGRCCRAAAHLPGRRRTVAGPGVTRGPGLRRQAPIRGQHRPAVRGARAVAGTGGARRAADPPPGRPGSRGGPRTARHDRRRLAQRPGGVTDRHRYRR